MNQAEFDALLSGNWCVEALVGPLFSATFFTVVFLDHSSTTFSLLVGVQL